MKLNGVVEEALKMKWRCGQINPIKSIMGVCGELRSAGRTKLGRGN